MPTGAQRILSGASQPQPHAAGREPRRPAAACSEQAEQRRRALPRTRTLAVTHTRTHALPPSLSPKHARTHTHTHTHTLTHIHTHTHTYTHIIDSAPPQCPPGAGWWARDDHSRPPAGPGRGDLQYWGPLFGADGRTAHSVGGACAGVTTRGFLGYIIIVCRSFQPSFVTNPQPPPPRSAPSPSYPHFHSPVTSPCPPPPSSPSLSLASPPTLSSLHPFSLLPHIAPSPSPAPLPSPSRPLCRLAISHLPFPCPLSLSSPSLLSSRSHPPPLPHVLPPRPTFPCLPLPFPPSLVPLSTVPPFP